MIQTQESRASGMDGNDFRASGSLAATPSTVQGHAICRSNVLRGCCQTSFGIHRSLHKGSDHPYRSQRAATIVPTSFRYDLRDL